MKSGTFWALISWLHVLVCIARSAPSPKQSFKDYLAINNCDAYDVRPQAAVYQAGNLNCTTVTDEKPSKFTYFDNKHINVEGYSFYTAFQGVLSFKENTPRYCFSESNLGNKIGTFDIHFKSELPNRRVRVEATPCRGGYWTNGKVLCYPQECGRFRHEPRYLKDVQYHSENLDVEINMHDLNKLPDGTTVIKFEGISDPRLIYNIKLNEIDYLSTAQFLKFCKDDGPCYKGKFLANDNVLYQYGGRPPIQMMKLGNKAVIGVRYDPRPFTFPEKNLNKKCSYKQGMISEICYTPSGRHAWKILWETSLPFAQEWLNLSVFVRFSYKHNCTIDIIDQGAGKTVNYDGPCGQYAAMSLGNFPYPKVGVYSKDKDGEGEFKMRFRNISIW